MQSYPPHLAYYRSLEEDLVSAGRYVEISSDNFSTYSIQFARLLLAAGSEVDVVAKDLCKQTDPTSKRSNINDYRSTLLKAFPSITSMRIGIQWNPVRVTPWAQWASDPVTNPDWWGAYNAVKHSRNANEKLGNLQNALSAIAGLYCLIRNLEVARSTGGQETLLIVESW